MRDHLSGNRIRQDFIDFFISKGHKFVPSSSLVPGGDQTLLFTNAGMVQFKDVFLGVDKRDYQRAVNSQKCMRVAGKHNDLDDVGRDDTHHTFFEMLGNWSFGDYYKDEAISWAWELLTDVWGLEKDRLWVTCFKDERGKIETDEEAASAWALQTGLIKEHILFFGRKDNFWEMADVGPCGPCSEIHYDRGEDACDKKGQSNHHCAVNGDCRRFLELWNLVFIQYNRTGPDTLEPLPSKHVDTGMGFERIVSVLQGVNSNYKTDLLLPLMDVVMHLCEQDEESREENITPYRVIADHARAATFLISDGVVPGNIGRNYICRMIIRRAARFGAKLGLQEPFLAEVAEKVIEIYGEAYPEIVKNRSAVLDNLTQEEIRFQATVEAGLAVLDDEIKGLREQKKVTLSGQSAFDLYATHGLPLEITKDVLREQGMQVDEEGFHASMDAHRIHSGAGKEFGPLGGEDAEFFSHLADELKEKHLLPPEGVLYDPYEKTISETQIVAIIQNGQLVDRVGENENAVLVIQSTGFYLESGGQVADTGWIRTKDEQNIFEVIDVRKPAPGVIVHIGKASKGQFHIGDPVIAEIDMDRRRDIMRNHTATHLLHAQLRKILGNHVRQAGSLVAPDRLRFDFTHPNALTDEQISQIERGVNEEILDSLTLDIQHEKLQDALNEGATALFGEKYGDEVRTILIEKDGVLSYELCGGTHVHDTSEIGVFVILSEGSVAAGVRRIEAVTGRKALQLVMDRNEKMKQAAQLLACPPSEIDIAIEKTLSRLEDLRKQVDQLKSVQARSQFEAAKNSIKKIGKMQILVLETEKIDSAVIRELADQFRNEFTAGIAVFANQKNQENIEIIITVTEDLVTEGYHAGKIAGRIAEEIGGKGGGRPQLAQGGGKDGKRLSQVLKKIDAYLEK